MQKRSTWSALRVSGLTKEVVALKGWVEPTEIQSLAFPKLVEGKNAVIVAPTGTGKTGACFLPIGERLRREEDELMLRTRPNRPRAIVLAPSRELASQLWRESRDISHVYRYRTSLVAGGGSAASVRRSLRKGLVDVLVGTPGRVLSMMERGDVVVTDVRTVVVDEADTMADSLGAWVGTTTAKSSADACVRLDPLSVGSRPSLSLMDAVFQDGSFAAAVGSILRPILGREGDPVQSVFLAATLSSRQFGALKHVIPSLEKIQAQGTHALPSSLEFEVVNVASDKRGNVDKGSGPKAPGGKDAVSKLEACLEIVRASKSCSVVFCNSASAVRAVGHLLEENGVENVYTLHKDMPESVRKTQFDRFQSSENAVLVSTDAASRGLDLQPNLVVISFDFPPSALTLIHRMGRTARAGKKGRAILLARPHEDPLARAIFNAVRAKLPLTAITALDAEWLAQKPDKPLVHKVQRAINASRQANSSSNALDPSSGIDPSKMRRKRRLPALRRREKREKAKKSTFHSSNTI